MSNATVKRVTLVALCALVSACSTTPVKLDAPYTSTTRTQLYHQAEWSLEGRLAVTGNNESSSASIIWKHQLDKEWLKLSGPLGQGATVVELVGGRVTIDRGDGHVQSSTQPELFISQQLGLFVPLQSLRYWMIGLPEPTQTFTETQDGFIQAGWLIEYKQMQLVGAETMPRKVTVMNKRVKLKLMIDQWTLK